MSGDVEIRTGRLLIREFTESDVAPLSEITGDPEVVRYLSFGATSEAEARGMAEFAVASASGVPRTEYVLAITEVSSNVLVGSCGLSITRAVAESAEVYFVLRKASWGMGLGREALAAMLEFAFAGLGLARVFGQAHPDNHASIRVMESVGMTYDGLGENPLAFAGDGQAGLRYAILRSR